jgi:hypothetical protein
LQAPVALQPASVHALGAGQAQQRAGLPTQEPAAHWLLAVQDPPSGMRQLPSTQTRPLAQSASPEQGAVRQVPLWQVKGLQEVGVPAAHWAPPPGQVLTTRLSPEQLAPHMVPRAATVQWPPPSQVPSGPQIGLAGSIAQLVLVGGSPARTLLQVPVAQVRQPEQDETLQQMPCTQNWRLGVCRQSAASSQGPPGSDWPHLPFWQVLGGMHWESRVQPERHWGRLGSHMMPGQGVVAPGWQVPLLHWPGAVTTPSTHLAGEQRVPER